MRLQELTFCKCICPCEESRKLGQQALEHFFFALIPVLDRGHLPEFGFRWYVDYCLTGALGKGSFLVQHPLGFHFLTVRNATTARLFSRLPEAVRQRLEGWTDQ
jgi:hypothetical protein